MTFDKNGSKKPINLLRSSNQTNSNSLINYILQNTFNLSRMFWESRPS